MNKWVTITEEEKRKLVESMKKSVSITPTCFNLKSDNDNVGSRFRDMTNQEVVDAAKESAHEFLFALS
jgi:hypothetical protein